MHENWHFCHHNVPPNLIQILRTIPTPQAILTAVTQASKLRATPEIKSPEIKSLIPLIKETPGRSGIIEPTIKVVGDIIIPSCVSRSPTKAIRVEAAKLAKADIELILIIFL